MRAFYRFVMALLIGAQVPLFLPLFVDAKVRIIPLPAISTKPNEGATFGILPVFLLLDEQDHIQVLLAPSLTFNEIFGVTGTFRLFAYPDGNRQFQIIASLSSKINRDYRIFYEDPGFSQGRFLIRGEAFLFKDPAARFFGLGAESDQDDETNFTQSELGLTGTIGINLLPSLQLSLTERFRRVRIEKGGLNTLPFLRDRFPRVSGANGGVISAQRLAVTYDSRDSSVTPTEGEFAQLFVELSEKSLGSEFSFRRYGLELKKLFPNQNKRFTLAVRGLLEAVDGDMTPFFEKSHLGGDETLRGFGDGRFIDNHRLVLNVEERIIPFKFRLLDVFTNFEISPFLEIGKVFHSFERLSLNDVQVIGGISFRAVVHPNVVGHIEVGYGSEGSAVFVGLDYPF
ncbi:MAG: BamA/TamA family outer membrane protein [Candidatus Tectomicrobia bacterium]|nr:BamA/TamA family outer membrane protein [Candidatus Tectomicrobia bacterium]